MRKRLLIAFSILMGLALLVLFIPTVFKKPVARALKRELNRRVDATVGFSSAEINLWRNFPQFTVSLEDFVIAGDQEFLGDTLVRAAKVHLVLSSSEFLFNEGLEVRHLSLENPDIHIVEHQNGRANYDITRDDPADSARDVVLNIQTWDASNARVRYETEESDFHLFSQDLTASGEVSIHGNVTHFTLKGITQAFSIYQHHKKYIHDKRITLNLIGSYDRRKQILKFPDNAISVNDLNLKFSGGLEFREEATGIDLKIRSGEAEFEDILSLSQHLFRDFDKMDIQGTMTLDAHILGTYNVERNKFPSFKANMVVNGGSIKYRALPSSVNEINFDLSAFNTDGNLQKTIISLQYFGMNVGENPVFGSGEIKGFQDGSIHADIMANIPLEDIARIYPLDSLDLTGELGFELKADGPYTGKLSDIFSRPDWIDARIPAFELGINLTGGSIRYTGLSETISDVNLHLQADNKSGIIRQTHLKIEKLQALLGANPINGTIEIDGLSEPFITSELNARVNLDDIKNFYPVGDLTLKGMMDVALKVDGKWSEESKLFPKVFATLRVDDGFIKSREYPAPMERAHLSLKAVNETGKFADTRFFVDTLAFVIEDEPFVVEGLVQDLEKYEYDLTVQGKLQLEKVQKIFALNDVSMSGEVDVNVEASGNLNDLKASRYHRLPTSGTVTLKNVFLQNEWLHHGLLVKEGHMVLTNEKIFLDTLHGRIGESHFNLTGHLYNYFAYLLHQDEVVSGDLLFESKSFDINELMRERKPVRDTVHHDLSAFELPPNIDFSLQSSVGELRYKNLIATDFKGVVRIQNGTLTLNKTTFNALDASFNLSGDYDPRDPSHPKFDIDLAIHELNISKAHEAFVTVEVIAPAAEHTFGIFSIDYKLKGELSQGMFPQFESLEGTGTIRIRDAEVNGMKLFHHISGLTKKEELMNPMLKDIVMEVDIDHGSIFIKPFTMKLGGFETEITGKHELMGSMNYLLKIALPPFDIVKIPLHVDGTYDNPKVHIGKGHEEDLRKAIEHNASLVKSPTAE